MHHAAGERSCRPGGQPTRIVGAISHATADEPTGDQHAAVTALQSGRALCLPTETVPGLAVLPEAVETLREIKGTPRNQAFAVAYADAQTAMAAFDDVTKGMERLASRWLPGPLTLVGLTAGAWTGVRVPDHALIKAICEHLGGPLVLTSANRHGSPTPATAYEAATALDDPRVHLLDGESGEGRPSTVVRAAAGRLQILREGAIPSEEVRRVHGRRLLFVCTGNTCRSPMAAAAARRLLSEALGIKPGRLKSLGYVATSAGMEGEGNAPMSKEALGALAAAGVATGRHRSRLVTGEMLASVDQVWCLTQAHRDRVLDLAGDSADRLQVSLLCPDNTDVPDPFGGTAEMYRTCLDRLTAALQEQLPRML